MIDFEKELKDALKSSNKDRLRTFRLVNYRLPIKGNSLIKD